FSNSAVSEISIASGSQALSLHDALPISTITATDRGISGFTTLTVTNAALLSIQVTPIDPTVAAGFNQQFTAIGTFSDGTMENLTDQVSTRRNNSASATMYNALCIKELAS